MPPPSLLQLCTKAAIQNVKNLNDIGDMPYSLARPFLLKIESPSQLRLLELQSPHIMQEDKELWLEFIKRDVPDWEKFKLPEESDCWYDVYRDLLEQVQRRVDEDAEKMKLALEGINSERSKHSSKFIVDRRTVRLPKERPTTKQKYASHDRRMGGISPVFVNRSQAGVSFHDELRAPLWVCKRPELPRTPSSKKASPFAVKRNKALAVPTHCLSNKASQIKQVPRFLIEDHKAPPRPQIPTRSVSAGSAAPKSPSAPIPKTSSASDSSSSSLREREARLRALTSSKPGASQTSTSRAASPPSRPITNPPPDPPAAPTNPAPESAASFSPPTSASHGMPESSLKSDGEASSSKSPSVAPPRPPPPLVRKRPPPSIFIQPKKKKVA
ncbi:putative RNA polymerase II transcription factor SIII subunit A [Thermoascus aurantiacus ATCC 26904]